MKSREIYKHNILPILESLVSTDLPETGTLLAAKSYGGLTNICQDAKCIFTELQIIFRDISPYDADRTSFVQAAFRNEII